MPHFAPRTLCASAKEEGRRWCAEGLRKTRFLSVASASLWLSSVSHGLLSHAPNVSALQSKSAFWERHRNAFQIHRASGSKVATSWHEWRGLRRKRPCINAQQPVCTASFLFFFFLRSSLAVWDSLFFLRKAFQSEPLCKHPGACSLEVKLNGSTGVSCLRACAWVVTFTPVEFWQVSFYCCNKYKWMINRAVSVISLFRPVFYFLSFHRTNKVVPLHFEAVLLTSRQHCFHSLRPVRSDNVLMFFLNHRTPPNLFNLQACKSAVT